MSVKKTGENTHIAVLQIKASDNGKPSKSSICRLHIEWIPKPKLAKQLLAFEEIPLSFSVMENDPVAHMVGVISAQPIDSPVWFTIKGKDLKLYNQPPNNISTHLFTLM